MQFERINVGTWAKMDDAFAKYYKYNTDMALNHTQFQNMAQKDDKSFKEYAQH